MEGIEEWWSEGEWVTLRVGAADRTIFRRRLGSGPTLTLLHGFPSSSFDWARIGPQLATTHTLLVPDFLGFGASEKPAEHTYSIIEQADLLEALWAHESIERTALLAHDYGVSVVQELLSRGSAGSLAVEQTAVTMLNGGVYPELARLEPGQLALLDPELGPRINSRIDERGFSRSLAATFAPDFDAREACAAMWKANLHGGGTQILHRLIRYVDDRARHQTRWVDALEQTDVPIRFVWGMLDPVSGSHMAQRIAERMPTAPLCAIVRCGHWPMLEEPERLVAALRDA